MIVYIITLCIGCYLMLDYDESLSLSIELPLRMLLHIWLIQNWSLR